MAKSLLYLCVDHPGVKALSDRFGDVITMDQSGDLIIAPYQFNGLDYCPSIFCQEGSSKYLELKENNGVLNGHHYSVVKTVRSGKK